MMKAAMRFEAALKKGPKVFNVGDPISKTEATELGLASKPDLVEGKVETLKEEGDDA